MFGPRRRENVRGESTKKTAEAVDGAKEVGGGGGGGGGDVAPPEEAEGGAVVEAVAEDGGSTEGRE